MATIITAELYWPAQDLSDSYEEKRQMALGPAGNELVSTLVLDAEYVLPDAMFYRWQPPVDDTTTTTF